MNLNIARFLLIALCLLPNAHGEDKVLFIPAEKILMRDVADFLNRAQDFESREDWLAFLKTAYPSGMHQRQLFEKLSAMVSRYTLSSRRNIVIATGEDEIRLRFTHIYFREDQGYLGDSDIGQPHYLSTGITFYFREDGSLIKASSNAMTLGGLLELKRPELNLLDPPSDRVKSPPSTPEKKPNQSPQPPQASGPRG